MSGHSIGQLVYRLAVLGLVTVSAIPNMQHAGAPDLYVAVLIGLLVVGILAASAPDERRRT